MRACPAPPFGFGLFFGGEGTGDKPRLMPRHHLFKPPQIKDIGAGAEDHEGVSAISWDICATRCILARARAVRAV